MPAEMAVLEGLPNKLCLYEKSSSALWILLKIIPTVILKTIKKSKYQYPCNSSQSSIAVE